MIKQKGGKIVIK